MGRSFLVRAVCRSDMEIPKAFWEKQESVPEEYRKILQEPGERKDCEPGC